MKDDNKTKKQLVDELTELRLQNAALKESESAEKYRSLVENIRDVIYELDSQGVVLYISPAVRDMLGFDSTEIVGKSFIDLAYKDDLTLMAEWFSELSKGTEKPSDYRALNKSGELRWVQTKTRPVIEGGVFKGARGILIDVTTQRRAEEALRKSQEKYHWMLNNIADVITLMDMNLRFTYVSPSIIRMRGYTAEEAVAQTFEQVMPPESLQISAKVFEEEIRLEASGMADPDRIRIVEVEQYKKDGSIVLMENHLSFMRDEAKKAVGIISVSHDISQRRRAEEALKKAKTLLDKTFSSMDEAIIIVDSNTRRIIACNHATEIIFGFGEKDLIGCSTDILHVDKLSYDLFGQELFPALDANGVFRTEFQMRRKDGSVFPTENTVTEILDDLGHRISVVSVVRDITARRMAEKKLKQTNIFLDSIIENIPNMIFLKDARDLRFIRFNRAGEDLLGYSRDDLLGKSDYDFFPKEQADHFTKKDRDVLNGKEVVDIPEEPMQTRTKGERTLHTKKVPLLDAKGEPEFLLGISEDITERKKMEETLRERDIQFKKLSSWAPGMIYQFTKRPDGTFCVPFTTEAIKDIFGCSPQDVREDFSPIARVILPEDFDKVMGSIEDSAKHLTIWTCEYRAQIPGQSTKWLLGIATPEKLVDGSISWYGFNTDITERKKAEAALRDTEARYRLLFEHSPDGIVIIDPDTARPLEFNESAHQQLGYSREEFARLSIFDLEASETPEETRLQIAKSMCEGWNDFETVQRTRQGEIRNIHVTVQITKISGKPLYHCVWRDITERKQAERKLKQSEERYRSIFENAQEGIFRSTPDGKIIMTNQAMAKMFGYESPEEMVTSITDIARQLHVDPEDRKKIIEMIEKHGFIKGNEAQNYRKDGSIIWISRTMQAVRDEKGQIMYYDGIIEDITNRKESAERMRKALGATIQAIAVTVETRDPYTAGHQRRVADLARAMATEMNLSSDQIDGLRMAATIHDLGKISVPAEILSKPAELTNIEFSLIKTHAQSGYDILKDIDFPWPIARTVLEHHERINGSGYPNGLTGDNILLESRILAVADVVESMASHRPYRPGLGIEAALDEIEKNKGLVYDNTVVDTCLRLFREKGYKLED